MRTEFSKLDLALSKQAPYSITGEGLAIDKRLL